MGEIHMSGGKRGRGRSALHVYSTVKPLAILFTMTTRRQFLQTGLLAAATVAFSRPTLFAETEKPLIRLAIQTWTFRLFDLEEAIQKAAQAGINEVEIAGGTTFGGQQKRTSTFDAGEKKRLKAILEENNVRAISLGGCRGLPGEFEFAKEMGLQFLQGEPPLDTLVEVSRRAEEYGIRFALHNHAKPNPYWDYREILKRLDDCSPAMGFCPDTGHNIRSGLDPLEVIRGLKGRLVSVHLKDLNDVNPEARPEVRLHDVPWGTGTGQIEAILNELKDQKFTGPMVIEYEHNWEITCPKSKNVPSSSTRLSARRRDRQFPTCVPEGLCIIRNNTKNGITFRPSFEIKGKIDTVPTNEQKMT